MKKNVLLAITILAACLSANAQFTTTKALKTGTALPQRSAPQIKPERIGKVEKVAKARFNPNLVPVKEVLSSRKLKNGSELRLVRLENGMVKKQFLHAKKKLQRKIIPPAKSNRNVDLRAGAASDESLFEDFEEFEGWDTETLSFLPGWTDWLPEGWTDESHAGSVSHLTGVYGDEYNFTWRTSPFNPKSGQYSAGVQFAFPVDTLSGKDTVTYNPPPQDEWLISPPVTVTQANYVFAFDLYYDPSWGRLVQYYVDENDELQFEFGDDLHTVVEALISTDGGNNWIKKWDNRADAAQYMEDELEYMLFYDAPWIEVVIDLEEYHNRDIQIAIRYWDDGGESVYVDNVTVGYVVVVPEVPKVPEVSYRRPEGHLISGLSTDYLAFSPEEVNLTVGHAYTPTLWEGNVKYHESVGWSFNDGEGNPVETFTGENPTVSLPYNLYETPLLTAWGKGGTSAEFQLGSADDKLMLLGYPNIWQAEDDNGNLYDVALGLGNYDLQYGFMIYSDINTEDLAGYGLGTYKGVANYFEKPAAKYLFEHFYVHLGNIVAKPDEPVKLNIYAVDEDYNVGEIIASSEAWPEEFIHAFNDTIVGAFGESFIYKYYTVPFKFKAIDPETGREYDSYIEIDDHFLAEFYNYQSADIFFQYEDHPTGEGYAYVTFEEDVNHEDLLYLGATSALFDTDATFPFLFAEEDNEFAAPADGGDREFTVGTYWAASAWWLKEELPDWITIEDMVHQGDIYYTLSFAVAPLPEDVPGRSANVTVQAPGCEMTLKFKQGDADWFSGINTVGSKTVKVFSQGDRFVLTCPAGTSSVAVYSVAGQKFAEYALNSAGTYSIPAARLPKGVYILKFAGKTNEMVKVVK